MKNLVKKLFTKEDLEVITSAINEVEKSTSGEVRVSIRQKRKWKERKLSIEDIAKAEFQLLGMTKTKERTGVLIFILLEDKKFYIYADEGINAKVEMETWQTIANNMSQHFSQKHFCDGVIYGIKAVGEKLYIHFPRRPDDENELPNEVKVK